MAFSPTINTLIEPKNHKNRGRKTSKWPSYNFGNGVILLMNEGRLEFSHLEFIRKQVKNFPDNLSNFFEPYKRLIWRSKRRLRTPKIVNWNEIQINLKKCFLVKLSLNCPVTKKSKNSRMGKGKGSFIRWTLRCSKFFKLLEFRYLSFFKIKLLYLILKKKLPFKVILLLKKDLFRKKELSFTRGYYWTQYVRSYKNYSEM